jgi:hypothetical protein
LRARRDDVVQPNAAGLCDAIFRALPLLGDEPVVVGLPDTIWYPTNGLAKLPHVPSDAHNAVAAAFRSGEICVVDGSGAATGAVAVPILTAAGCAGVFALELMHRREQHECVRAAATIIAAQLDADRLAGAGLRLAVARPGRDGLSPGVSLKSPPAVAARNRSTLVVTSLTVDAPESPRCSRVVGGVRGGSSATRTNHRRAWASTLTAQLFTSMPPSPRPRSLTASTVRRHASGR